MRTRFSMWYDFHANPSRIEIFERLEGEYRRGVCKKRVVWSVPIEKKFYENHAQERRVKAMVDDLNAPGSRRSG